MAFVKKTWKDRIVQYANRRLLTKSGGEVEQVTVTRDEGTVTEAGDKFDAATMNDLEDRLEYAFDNVSTAIECTQAEYDTWKNAGQLKLQTSYIITDAPNLNPTASDIEYSSGVTVKQAIDSKASATNYPNFTKILSVATDGSTVRFVINHNSDSAFSIFVMLLGGTLLYLGKASSDGVASYNAICGSINGHSEESTKVYLNVGNYKRATFIITSNDSTGLGNISITTS